MTGNLSPVTLGGATCAGSAHVCALFRNHDEEYQVMLQFLKEGLLCGDKAVLINDDRGRDDQAQRLSATGVDISDCERIGQLSMFGWGETYLRTGGFNQHDMLSLVDEVLTGSKRQGFERTRAWANMDWALGSFSGTHNLVEYESRLNHVLPKHHHCVVCAYDLTKFSASIVTDVIRTHPFVIVGGMLRVNAFYVPPDEFLRELNARKH